jgi:Asp-tRNA(Asn)/Glu-tRNA(Gln) amidotransferase A subunit family amidase
MGPIAGGLPSGLQVIGGRFDDARVLRVADAYQHVTDWHTRVPHLETTVAR